MAINVHGNIIKTYVIWLAVLGFLAFAGWQSFLYITNLQYPKVPVTIKGTTFDVRVASSDATRTKGLSGTKSLDEKDGMLFIFSYDDEWGIWMKDMAISIDILWLDKDGTITYMVKGAEPGSYPHTTYRPSKPARYVLELSAGTIDRKGFRIGDKATFDVSHIKEGEE